MLLLLQSKVVTNIVSIIYLDVNPTLAKYFAETTHSCDYIQSISSSNSTIILPDWTCNEMNYTTFDFSRFTDLEYLEIGSNSFGFVDTFIIDGLSKLTTLIIGGNSFTEIKNGAANNPDKSFHIKNCQLLTLIEINDNSFSDFSGEFELVNLPSLKSIKIGNADMLSNSFFYSPFIIRGTYLIGCFEVYRFTKFAIY